MLLACAAFGLALAPLAHAQRNQSDLLSYPALPAPSEAALAAAPQLSPTDYPWTQAPDVADFLHVYPRRALREGVSGTVELECLVVEDLRVACRVVSARPARYEFGDAAMALSGKLRVAPALANGEPTMGGKLRWTVEFASRNRIRTPGSAPS
jgi:outer membrane biosynthesis protein TonB